MKRVYSIIITTVATMTAGCEIPATAEEPGGSARNHGAAIFPDPSISGTKSNAFACSTCHEGLGGDALGKILPGAVLAGVVDRSTYWGGSQVDLLEAINDCLFYFMQREQPWGTQEKNAEAMYAFLEWLPPELPDPVPFTIIFEIKEPPPGDADRGSDLYSKACDSCHGAAHTGKSRLTQLAPVLPEQTLDEHPLGTYTALERRLVFVQKVRHGNFVNYGGIMPPFSQEKLSDQDLGDIITFLGVP